LEPMIPPFERVKTVHALDRAATVMGITVLVTNILLGAAYEIRTYNYGNPYQFTAINKHCKQQNADKSKTGHAGHVYSPKHTSKYVTLSHEATLTCEAMFRL
jgi:hypothetical protein